MSSVVIVVVVVSGKSRRANSQGLEYMKLVYTPHLERLASSTSMRRRGSVNYKAVVFTHIIYTFGSLARGVVCISTSWYIVYPSTKNGTWNVL